MKRKSTAYILLLVTACALLAGCGRSVSDADRLLARIDSLADVDPDSADLLLKPALSPSLKGREKEEVALLLRIKVDDKLYRPVTHYRDTILQLVSYFEQHPKVLPSVLGSTGPALPYLYAGRIFADLGDAPQALDYYQRALDVQPARQMEKGKMRIENEDARRLAKQRGLLHSFIGTQFFYQDLHDEAIASFQEANHWAELAQDTIDIIFNLRDIAEQFMSIHKADSSLFYYRNALNLSNSIGDYRMIYEIKSQIAAVFCELGRFQEAKVMILPSLSDVDTASITSIYNIASKIYKSENNLDSAIMCYNKLLEFGNIYGRCNAHRELSDIALKNNNLAKAANHLHHYKILDDSIRARDNAETVARMHAAYNYQKHESEAFRLKSENERKLSVIIILLLSAISLFLISYVLYKRNLERKQKVNSLEKEKKELSREKEELVEEKIGLKEEISRLEQKQTLFIGHIDKDLKNVKHLIAKTDKTDDVSLSVLYREKRRLDHVNNLIAVSKSQADDRELQLKESNIYLSIQQKINEKFYRMSIDEWLQLEDTLNILYGNFVERLKAFASINEDELHISMMLKIKLQHKHIAAFLCKTPSAETNIRKRLYDRIFMTDDSSASEWDAFILDF